MDGDEVNSIADTIESTQVAQIVRDTFEEIISSRQWPHLDRLIQLTPQGAARPTHMDTDTTWDIVHWIKYNKIKTGGTRDLYDEIKYMDPKDFLELLNARNSSDSDVTTVTDTSNIDLLIFNDIAPTFWTTFDDEVLIFDSHDNLVDTNLQASKTQVWGHVEPTWTHTDVAVPDLSAKAFSYLLSEAKSAAFNALRQTGNAKEEQKSRRQRVHLAREKWVLDGGQKFPDYGR